MGGFLFFVAILAVGWLAYVRYAPTDVEKWHIDPETAKFPRKKNSFKTMVIDSPRSADNFLSEIEKRALQEGAIPIAGSIDEGWVTFESRSNVLKYPDFSSFKAIENEHGTTLFVVSRSRFGYNDLGVNNARMMRWLQGL